MKMHFAVKKGNAMGSRGMMQDWTDYILTVFFVIILIIVLPFLLSMPAAAKEKLLGEQVLRTALTSTLADFLDSPLRADFSYAAWQQSGIDAAYDFDLDEEKVKQKLFGLQQRHTTVRQLLSQTVAGPEEEEQKILHQLLAYQTLSLQEKYPKFRFEITYPDGERIDIDTQVAVTPSQEMIVLAQAGNAVIVRLYATVK